MRMFGSPSWSGRSSENSFNLLQSLALGLRDEGDGEDGVGDAHGGKEPEGSSVG